MNENWKRLWLDGIVSSVAVAATAVVRGQIEGRSIWTPINAVSHIVWGRLAAQRRDCTLRYTGTGLLLNAAACVFWAGCYQIWRKMRSTPNSSSSAAVAGVGTSALAYITDYHVVPRRFTPGFELSLSRRSFPWLYGALAVGMFFPQLIKILTKKAKCITC